MCVAPHTGISKSSSDDAGKSTAIFAVGGESARASQEEHQAACLLLRSLANEPADGRHWDFGSVLGAVLFLKLSLNF